MRLAFAKNLSCAIAGCLAMGVGAPGAAAATLPSGFQETIVASGLAAPTAMAVAPDGRIFVCQQGGQLRVIKNGVLLTTPFLTVTVDRTGERGLLGVALDPAFATNGFVYVYYTVPGTPARNRLSRFTAQGDVAVAGSQRILLDLNGLSSASNHNGGAIHFRPAPDGKLYIAVGDNANSANSQTLNNLLGKILRINADGTIPTDNPFYSTATGVNRAIWALGLRNPFTFAFQPMSGRMMINDVGQDRWEEVNEGRPRANYGWPTTEGPTSDPRFHSPLYAYQHSAGTPTGCAITGGAFYNPLTQQFPSGYTGDYFFADYCGGWIYRIDVSGPTATLVTPAFATGIASPVDLRVAEDGSLYYLARGSGSATGVVSRVRYTGNPGASITRHPSGITVALGQPATFSVAASGTSPLSYQWQRNSVNIAGATSPSYTLSNAQLSASGSGFRCRVTNSFGTVTSNTATLTVINNTLPVATIVAPAAGALYSGGQVIMYSGTGTDAEDGTLPAAAFTWQIVFHHDTHTHPFIGPTSGSRGGTFTIPRTGETSTNVWYRIYLTVRDSAGLTRTTQRDIKPRTVQVTLASSPSGLSLTLDGQPKIAPHTFLAVVGMQRTLGAPTPQILAPKTYDFLRWSDGGTQTHTIITPASATTITATYSRRRGSG
jgi:glucose/arabinose dehydrogenase